MQRHGGSQTVHSHSPQGCLSASLTPPDGQVAARGETFLADPSRRMRPATPGGGLGRPALARPQPDREVGPVPARWYAGPPAG